MDVSQLDSVGKTFSIHLSQEKNKLLIENDRRLAEDNLNNNQQLDNERYPFKKRFNKLSLSVKKALVLCPTNHIKIGEQLGYPGHYYLASAKKLNEKNIFDFLQLTFQKIISNDDLLFVQLDSQSS